MLHQLNQQYPGAAAGLLTTTNQAFDRVAMHAVRRELLEAQARGRRPAAARRAAAVAVLERAVRIDHDARRSTASSPTASRTSRSATCFSRTSASYREDRLAGSGLEPLFPIWKTKSTRDLAHEMIDGGLQARLTCIDPRKLDRSFAGRSFDQQLLNDLPAEHRPLRREWRIPLVRVRRADVHRRDQGDDRRRR